MKVAGHIEITDRESVMIADTLQCVHCGCHFPVKPSKGRGFCCNCNGPICGRKCIVCVPAEQRLENIESGRALNFKPIRVPVKKLVRL